MDRLSSYAKRESDERSPEQRQQAEEESINKLMEQMRIAKETKEKSNAAAEAKADDKDESETAKDAAANGAPPEDQKPADSQEQGPPNGANGAVDDRGVPESIKLFEIFHEQVMNLVSMQRLPIQDITALLVSLGNLAL